MVSNRPQKSRDSRRKANSRPIRYPTKDDIVGIHRRIVAEGDPAKSKIPPTRFLDHLARLHEGSTMRYGQIINNALQLKFGRNRHPGSGACYDTYYITDEEFTDMLEKYIRAAKENGEFKGP